MQKVTEIKNLRQSVDQKQGELTDIRKLLILIEGQDKQDIDQIEEEVEELEGKAKQLQAALTVAHSPTLKDCAFYWRECV